MVKSHDKFASAEEKLAHFYVYPHNTLTAKNLDLHTQNSQKKRTKDYDFDFSGTPERSNRQIYDNSK